MELGYKLIVLDEADMMTQQAQAALRRVIEQYTKNVRLCIICNYVNKIADIESVSEYSDPPELQVRWRS
ncbi:hypothetical protein DFH09DRAFT_1307221 [Mycena vulgaris]|nr:hypothetical protein DFH09DRAFT_1307221 [Mycena vulgaris]